MRIFLTALLSLTAALFATNTWSQDLWARDKLTGDWGGTRTELGKLGVDIEASLSQFYQDVTSGGVNPGGGGEYGLKFDTWVNIDAHKLFNTWEGLSIAVHVETRDGNDVLGDAGAFTLPNTALLYPLPGDYDGTQVTSFMVSQTLFGGKAAVVAGKLGAMDLLQGMFPQNLVDYGLGGFMNANSIMSILSWGRWLNLSQYGVAAWTFEREMPSTGIIVVGATNTTTTWSTRNAFSDGVGIMLFHRFVFDIDDKLGYVYVGAGGSTKDYPSLDPVDWTVLPGEGAINTKEKKPWSVAVYYYQVLWQPQKDDDKRRVQLFSGFSIVDDNPSFSNRDFWASVQSFGLFESRPGDRMGVAGHYYHLTNDFVDLVSDLPGENLHDYSWTFEAFYNVEINRWLHLTGDIQVAKNQNRNDNTVVIPGVRLVIDF